MNKEKKYPIKVVAHKTGLSMHVIRIWEKRYNAVVPERTETNRRLYSKEDILKLDLLGKAMEIGHSIGAVANLSLSELKTLVKEDSKFQYDSNGSASTQLEKISSNEYVDQFLSQLKNLNVQNLDMILKQASISLSRPKLIDEVIATIIEKIGENWRNGSLRIFHEHIATNVIRSFLSTLSNDTEYELNAPNIIVTTLKGQIHELGAMIVAASAVAEGWKVTYLGSNLPAEEIAAIAKSINAKLLALSIVYPASDPNIIQELEKLGQFLPPDISILVGGRAALSYKTTLDKINAKIIIKIQDLRKYLQNLENQL